MGTKRIIWFLMIVGGSVGGYVPLIWGSSLFSLSSIILSAVGAILGIWLGSKLTR